MSRRVLAVISVVATIASFLVACDRDGWDPEHFAPSLRPAFGARVTDGRLHIWTGSPCTSATEVNLDFTPNKGRLVLAPAQGQTATVEHLVLGGPYPNLEVRKPLPAGFDWRDAESLRLWINGDPGGLGSSADIAEIVKGSGEHPDDTYWFQDVGWLNPAEVAAQDRKTFLATCTLDPADNPSLPPAFGARVTDGKLRIWTGAPCDDTNGVTLGFEPSQAEWVLGKSGETVQLERLTLGEPYPGLEVITALPAGFDWRSQQTLHLDVHSLGPHEQSQTDLAEVIKGSADHPEDTYWFKGVGWLNPAQVAEQNGKTFLATCTPDPAK